MPPVAAENNFGAFVQVKSQMYTSVVSASLFGVLKCLDASRQLESATKTLENVAESPENSLIELEKTVKCLVYQSVLKNLGVLQSASKQLEVVTGDVEGYTRKLYDPVISKQHKPEVLKFYKNVQEDITSILYKTTASSLIKLSRINRKFEVVSGDLELLTHQLADPSFQPKQPLVTEKIIHQLKCILSLQVLEKLLYVSNKLDKVVVSLEKKTTTTQNGSKELKELIAIAKKNTTEYLEATFRKSNYLLLSTKTGSVLKLLEASKNLERATQKLEARLAFKPNDTDLNLYNSTLSSLLKFVDTLQRVSKKLETVTDDLEKKTIYEQKNIGFQRKQFYSPASALFNKTRNKFLCGLKETQKLADKLKVTQSSLVANFLLKPNLIVVTTLLQTSISLQKVTKELELFTKEIFLNTTESNQHSQILLLLSHEKTAIKKSAIAQSLWFVLRAEQLSKQLEKITTATESSVAKIREADFEKNILRQIKTTTISNALTLVAFLQTYSKLLESTTTNLEEHLRKKIIYKRTPRYKKRKRDKNSNNEDEDSVGRSYKMMSASKELERLLGELEAFVIDSANGDVRKKPSTLSKWKEGIDSLEKTSKAALHVILLKIALANATALHKTSKTLEFFTGNLEVAAKRFVAADFTKFALELYAKNKSAVYNTSIILSSWYVNLVAEISKIVQYVTADLELFTHEICYPSVRRKKVSFCRRTLQKSANQLYSLQGFLNREHRKIVVFTSHYLQALQKTTIETTTTLMEIPRNLYPKLINVSLMNVHLLSTLLKELQNAITDLEYKLNQPKIIIPQERQQDRSRLFTTAVYNYGRNRVVSLSTWCSNEIAELLKLLELILEKTKNFEPWNITVLHEINRIHVEFAKKLQCRLNCPSFTFEFHLEVNSTVDCYKTTREISNS